MQQVAIAVLVVVLMVAVGLRSDARDLRVLREYPRAFVVAAVMNLVLMPLVAAGLCGAASLPAPVTAGLVLCAASPGGATGPLFASQARGHLVTAIVAMIGLAAVSVFTAPPTVTWLLAGSDVDAGALLLPMMRTLFLFQLVPLGAGLAVRSWRPQLASRLARPMELLANGVLLAVIVGLMATKGGLLTEVGVPGLAVCVVLVLVALAAGATSSRAPTIRRSLSLVTGVRNISLALLLSASFFPDPLTDATILTFGLFTMAGPLLAAQIWRRRGAIEPD